MLDLFEKLFFKVKPPCDFSGEKISLIPQNVNLSL